MFKKENMYLQLLLIVTAHSAFGSELYEGSTCQMEDGSLGVCRTILDCRSRLLQISKGTRFTPGSGHCGYSGYVQIVCCNDPPANSRIENYNAYQSNPFLISTILSRPRNNTNTLSTRRKLRPADQACREYRSQKVGSTISIRIAEGIEASQEEFEYTVALGVPNYSKEGPPMQYKCGGSLIAPMYVLTAAHCVRPIKDKFPVEVRVGSVDLREESNKVEHIPIENIIRHPEYSGSRNYHDIAILRLKYPVSIFNNIVPICLQTKSLSTLRSASPPLIAAGWGATEFAGDMSPVLKRTPGLKLVDRDECQGFYTKLRSNKIPNGITENLLCVVDADEKRSADTCEGDSGGPLVSMSNFPTLVGITSFGQFCGSTIPSVYTAVLPYLDWIEKVVWE